MEPILPDSAIDPNRPTGVIDVDSELVSDISTLIESGQQAMVMNILSDLHPADLAIIVSHISKDLARQVLHWLPVETAAEVLAELDDDYRADGYLTARATTLGKAQRTRHPVLVFAYSHSMVAGGLEEMS